MKKIKLYESDEQSKLPKDVLDEMILFSNAFNDSIKSFINSIFNDDFILIEGADFVNSWKEHFYEIKNAFDRKISNITNYTPEIIKNDDYKVNSIKDVEEEEEISKDESDEDDFEEDEDDVIYDILTKDTYSAFPESININKNNFSINQFYEVYKKYINEVDNRQGNYELAVDLLKDKQSKNLTDDENTEKDKKKIDREVLVTRSKTYKPYINIYISVVDACRKYIEHVLKEFEYRLSNLYSNFSKNRELLGENQNLVVKNKLLNKESISKDASDFAAIIIINAFNLLRNKNTYSGEVVGKFVDKKYDQKVIMSCNNNIYHPANMYINAKISKNEYEDINKNLKELNKKNHLYKNAMDHSLPKIHQEALKDKDGFRTSRAYIKDTLNNNNFTLIYNFNVSEKIENINDKKENNLIFSISVDYKTR